MVTNDDQPQRMARAWIGDADQEAQAPSAGVAPEEPTETGGGDAVAEGPSSTIPQLPEPVAETVDAEVLKDLKRELRRQIDHERLAAELPGWDLEPPGMLLDRSKRRKKP